MFSLSFLRSSSSGKAAKTDSRSKGEGMENSLFLVILGVVGLILGGFWTTYQQVLQPRFMKVVGRIASWVVMFGSSLVCILWFIHNSNKLGYTEATIAQVSFSFAIASIISAGAAFGVKTRRLVS